MLKRVLILVGVLLGVVLLGVGALAASMFAGNSEIPEGRELESFARVIKDNYVAVGVLDAGPGAVVLIDAGEDFSGKALLAELARRKLGPEAVKAIFLTHGHVDHVAGCHLFPQAEVVAFAPDVALAEGKEGAKGPVSRLLPIKNLQVHVTRPLQGDETVQVGDLAVRAFSIPGHTGGSAAYLVRGVLFLGDSADASTEGSIIAARWPVTDDRRANRESLRKLAERLRSEQVKHMVFSHSGVLEGDKALQTFAAASGE
jgi:hydroxyacylglutathione hydrolase